MKYDYSLGIWGNLKQLYSQTTNINYKVEANKIETDSTTDEIKASVDYIAMMTDVELPDVEEGTDE